MYGHDISMYGFVRIFFQNLGSHPGILCSWNICIVYVFFVEMSFTFSGKIQSTRITKKKKDSEKRKRREKGKK